VRVGSCCGKRQHHRRNPRRVWCYGASKRRTPAERRMMRATRRTAELRNWWLLEQGFVGIATTSSSTVAEAGKDDASFCTAVLVIGEWMDGFIHSSSSSFVASRCFLDLLLVSACPNAYNHGWGVSVGWTEVVATSVGVLVLCCCCHGSSESVVRQYRSRG